jgi:hypothetical protein
MLNKLFLCSLLFVLTGCSGNKYIKTEDQFCAPATAKADAMAAAEHVLAKMHFTIEKLDAETGYIRTYPLHGAQTFEFWRTDNVGSFNRAEADLHSIRRTVELNITEQPEQLCINCKATTQRFSLPQDQTTVDRSLTVLSSSQRALQNSKLSPQRKANITWTDLGRDSQLETEITKRIEKQLASLKKEQKK